jgi:hypothetical protein
MLKELIRMMIQEDKKNFINKTKKLSYYGDFDDPLFLQTDSDSLANKKSAKDIKRLWAAEADHAFMNSVVKIHWLQDSSVIPAIVDDIISRINDIKNSSGRDEISTMGYIEEPYKSEWGDIGLVLKGRTTLAANNMDTILSGYHSMVRDEEDVRNKFKSSGIPKRPTMYSSSSAEYDYIFDRKDFSIYDQEYNEFILDNWKVIGLVFNEADINDIDPKKLKTIKQIIEQTGLKFYLNDQKIAFEKSIMI